MIRDITSPLLTRLSNVATQVYNGVGSWVELKWANFKADTFANLNSAISDDTALGQQSDLAANGGSVPETDRANEWTKTQTFNNTVNFSAEHDNGTVSSNTDIDWSNGINQVITLGADITLTFSNIGVGTKKLRVVQDSTGGRTPTLPTGKWPGQSAGSFSTSADAEDLLCIYYNGASYYYQLINDYG